MAGPLITNQDLNKSPKQQVGTGYTNIQRLIGANRQNQLGQAVGGGIQQAGQQARQQVQQAGQQFQQQTEQNKFDTEQNRQIAQQGLSAPVNLVGTEQGKQFGNLIAGNYAGPTGLQNQQALQSQATEASQLGRAIGSQAGQMGLLQRFVGKPQYQAGQQRLDALLLGQTGGRQLAEARRATAGLNPYTQSQIGAAQAQALEQFGRSQDFSRNLQQQFGQTVGGIESELSTKAQAEQAARQQLQQQTREALASGQLSPELAQQLGVSEGQMMFNIDPTKFLSESNLQANIQNIASQEDYARINALRQLAGTAAPQEAQNILGKFYGQEGQAGQFSTTKPFELDTTGYGQARQVAEQDYSTRLGEATSRREAAQEISNLANTAEAARQQVQQLNAQLGSIPPFDPRYQQVLSQLREANDTANTAQQTIASKYPGAVSGGITRTDWAQSNLQDASNRFAQTQALLEQMYGTQKFGIRQ